MRRPQSAKPGYKGYWGPASSEQFNDQDNNTSKNQHRKNIKIMKPDLTTNDFARILPKKIYQDKERLYSQGLQLKQSLNQTLQENVRLKTRISILQKQKDKMNKHIQMAKDTSMSKTNSRLNIYSMKNNQKQNMMIRNLKKMIRQSKQQNDYLKQENAKIKKAIKYTKINELQIQRKMLQEQNKRINNLLEQMNQQLGNQDDCQRQNAQLKKYLQEEVQNNKQLNQSNQKYLEYIESLEQKLKNQSEKHLNRENKLQREFALNKRKLNQSIKQVEDLRNQLKYIKQNNSNSNANEIKKKPAKLVRPVTSNPYKSQQVQQQGRVQTQDKKQAEELKLIKIQNQQLKSQLSEARNKLELSQRHTNIQAPNKPNVKAEENINKKNQPAKTPKKQVDNNQPFIIQSPQKNNSDTYQQNYQEPNYDNDYEQEYDQSPTKPKKQETQIQKYRKDFQQQQEEQPLYIKNDPKQPKQPKQQKQKGSKKNIDSKQKTKEVKNDNKKKKADGKDGKYKPDKKTLTEIKQILTYRMKAQRYPYAQLKKDIQQASQKKFSYSELKTMFNNEPFFLHLPYIQAILKYCFQKQKVKQTETITSQTLVNKLRKVIDDFELLDQKQEQEMLLRISQMVIEYPSQLEAAFQKIKNGEETVQKKELVQMFKKLELQDKYIELIITELSLCSQNLQHLNFHGFFERFYIDNGLQQSHNNQIDQEQIQSSSQQQSKNLKQKNNAKLKQIRNEFQDDGQNELAIDDGQRISLGDDHKNYDDDVVSDDGPI